MENEVTLEKVLDEFRKKGYCVNPANPSDEVEIMFIKQLPNNETLRIFVKKLTNKMKVYVDKYSISGITELGDYVEEELLSTLAFDVWHLSEVFLDVPVNSEK